MTTIADMVKIQCLQDILDKQSLFAGKYISYNDGLWYLDENENDYYLRPRLFNCLDENIRLFNFRFASSGGKRHYYIEENISLVFDHYKEFLFNLIAVAKGKTFKSLTDVCDYFVNNNYSCITSTVRFPLGIQGRYEDVKALIIRGRGIEHRKAIFLPYYGFSGNITQKDKIYKNLIRIFVLLYRPDLNYPFNFNGNAKTLKQVIELLYKAICEGMANGK